MLFFCADPPPDTACSFFNLLQDKKTEDSMAYYSTIREKIFSPKPRGGGFESEFSSPSGISTSTQPCPCQLLQRRVVKWRSPTLLSPLSLLI